MSYISATQVQDEVIVWERNEHDERVVKHYPAPYYFYVSDDNGKYKTIFGTSVERYTFDTAKELSAAKFKFKREDATLWESDITPVQRLLSSKYYNVPAPKLKITLLDIEVDYDPERGITVQEMVSIDPYAEINSVALVHVWSKQIVVFAVPPDGQDWTSETLSTAIHNIPNVPIYDNLNVEIVVCKNEKELLVNLITEIQDSDVISGWNSDFFDVPYIAQRVLRILDKEEVDLSTSETINEQGKTVIHYVDNPNPSIKQKGRFKWLKKLDFPTYGCPTFRPVTSAVTQKLMGNTVDLIGRLRVDYMNLVKKYEPGERPSYKLESVSNEVLVDREGNPFLPKLEYEGTLHDLYRKDFAFFVRYNIRDTEILYGFEKILGYIDVANQNYHLSTGLMEHVFGTIKLAEHALTNYCHHELKRVVRDISRPEIDRAIDGALVLYPQVGEHRRSGSIDINSLYPSAIRSLNISPETIRGQFTRDVRDVDAIVARSSVPATLVLEGSGEELTMPASEWVEYLLERKWAISGYGTVFDQSKMGFIPALLADWYKRRKEFQAKSKEQDALGNDELAGYYDRLQYVYKIKLNSLYGALTNLYFRFYDLRMGESTTGTGRRILKHQCRKTSEVLGYGYNVDFPLYATVADAIDAGYSEEEASQIALHGPVFNGQYQSPGVIYGDTDSTYFSTGETASDEEAIAKADDVAAQVNASFPQFMRETFLCQPGYDTLIKAGREIVSDRGIFVDKKRYILHIIDKEGKRTDKMKVMGLDTKKTTLPLEVRNALNGFIESYLKGEDWSSVAERIVQYKDDLVNRSATDITILGLPKGIKDLDKHMSNYSFNPDCALPGHVAAAIHYNASLKQYGDKLSSPITSGNKIKVFYLKRPVGRFKSIALPVDLEVTPSWFIENINVDVPAHIVRLVDNPIGNILKAIGKEAPSKQTLLLDQLFVY